MPKAFKSRPKCKKNAKSGHTVHLPLPKCSMAVQIDRARNIPIYRLQIDLPYSSSSFFQAWRAVFPPIGTSGWPSDPDRGSSQSWSSPDPKIRKRFRRFRRPSTSWWLWGFPFRRPLWGNSESVSDLEGVSRTRETCPRRRRSRISGTCTSGTLTAARWTQTPKGTIEGK